MEVNISGSSALEIFESIRDLNDQGLLSEGDSLPSVRELAEQLGVNRNTVSSAYQRLTKAGIAITKGRLGTSICQAADAGEQEGVSDTVLFDLADGSPRREWFPNLNDVASKSTLNQYLYGEETILPEIYQYGKNWFADVCATDFDVTVCNGAIDTLERMITAHLTPGDKVVVEEPCYISSANVLRQAGMQLIGSAVDEQGLCPKALKSALEKGAKAVLVTPRAHNPTGVSISASRAKELQAILAAYPRVLVLEDDHFALVAKTKHYSVISEHTANWAIFRSVSKGLGPDLRMAFVAADKESIKRINTRLAPGMSWVSRVLQSLVYTCLTQEAFKQQLLIAKKDCAKRRDMVLSALHEKGLIANTVIDGLNVWLPVHKDSKTATYEFSRKGWLVRPSSSFDIDQTSYAVRVSVQNLGPDNVNQFALDAAAIINGK